jgi:integrase
MLSVEAMAKTASTSIIGRIAGIALITEPVDGRWRGVVSLGFNADGKRVRKKVSGWRPKEMRTSFVSMMSYKGVPVEEIARLAGHASSRTTEVIYRRWVDAHGRRRDGSDGALSWCGCGRRTQS